MADIKENEMSQLAAAFLRCLDSAGNSGVISLETLLSMSLKNLGLLGDNDLTEVGNSFGYAYGEYDGSNVYGIYLSISVIGYYFQLKARPDGNLLKFRTYDAGSKRWSSWHSFSFIDNQ